MTRRNDIAAAAASAAPAKSSRSRPLARRAPPWARQDSQPLRACAHVGSNLFCAALRTTGCRRPSPQRVEKSQAGAAREPGSLQLYVLAAPAGLARASLCNHLQRRAIRPLAPSSEEEGDRWLAAGHHLCIGSASAGGRPSAGLQRMAERQRERSLAQA